MMKSIGICYSERAIKVSNSHSNQANCSPSIQNEVTCVYKVKLSTGKQFLITLSWSNLLNKSISVSISEIFPNSSSKNSQSSIIPRKVRGMKTLESCGSRMEVYWDLCRAQYNSGLEPVKGFYIVILVNSELSLVLGDMEEQELEVKKRVFDSRVSEFTSLMSRKENFSGNGAAVYSTRVRFCDMGSYHDIVINCDVLKSSILSVYIDNKSVLEVKRLQWNFRGNQTIFLDGLLVDLMWNLHDLFFKTSSSSRYCVFLFRTRSGLDSRLWFEDKNEQEKVGFSLLICGCKNPD